MMRWVLLLFLYMIVASLVVHATIDSGVFHRDNRVTLAKYVYNDADRPFAYRVLPGTMVRTATQLTPETVRTTIEDAWSEIPRYRSLDWRQGFVPGYELEYFYAMLLMYATLIAIAFVLRAILLTIGGVDPLAAALTPALAVAFLPVMVGYYLYDFPILLWFALAVLALLRGHTTLYYASFLLACVTKETSLFLPWLFFLARQPGLRTGALLAHLGVQGAIWAGIQFGLRRAFADNPGGPLEFHFFDYNLPLLTNPASFLKFNSLFLPTGLNIIAIGLLAFLVIRGWKRKPRFLKLALSLVVPLAGLLLFFGLADEMRTYFEAVPVLFPLAVLGLASVFPAK